MLGYSWLKKQSVGVLLALLGCVVLTPVTWGGTCFQHVTANNQVCTDLWLHNDGNATWTLTNKISPVPGGSSGGTLSGNQYDMVAIPSAGYVFVSPAGGFLSPGTVSGIPQELKPHTRGELIQWCATVSASNPKDPELVIEYKSNYGQVVVLDYAMHADGCSLAAVSSLPAGTINYITHNLSQQFKGTVKTTGNDSVTTVFGTPPRGAVSSISWTFKTDSPSLAPAITPILQDKMTRLQPGFAVTCTASSSNQKAPHYSVTCQAKRKET
ncbi:MAG: hypothetical protein A3J38_04605 [Gammaproteobacteria bacterium RIFCSPHIGHO2_12_FULL_45_9]|nr:MAG: hypothetical protein A3J38_04605 [Gammaproteobacteria bacterium RIFCSPHIGHO2_12_FULL_45_9]